jgi:hypothetical protein
LQRAKNESTILMFGGVALAACVGRCRMETQITEGND